VLDKEALRLTSNFQSHFSSSYHKHFMLIFTYICSAQSTQSTCWVWSTWRTDAAITALTVYLETPQILWHQLPSLCSLL